jgi:hypothetical protein
MKTASELEEALDHLHPGSIRKINETMQWGI